MSTKDSTTSIRDEYYNVFELDEEVFQPLGAEQFACANQSLTAVCEEASSLKEPAGPILGILSSHIRARQNIYCRRAIQTSHPSGNICTPGRDEHFGKSAQRSPLYKRLALGANLQLTFTVLDANGKKANARLPERDATYKKWLTRVALGASENSIGVTLADLGDVDGFGEDGEEDQLYAFQLADGMYRRKKLPQKENGPPNCEELSDIDITHATPKRVHKLVFTGENGFPLLTPSNKLDGLLT